MCFKKKSQRQIAMGWVRKEPTPCPFPEGYEVEHYSRLPEQRREFFRLWTGKYGTEEEVNGMFYREFEHYHDCKPEKDIFFVRHNGEIIGTITAIHHPHGNLGYVHMVALREDYRGKHLSRPLNYLAMRKIYDDGSDYAFLTTNEWRQNAIRGYINAGFLPLMNGKGKEEKAQMIKRWQKVYSDLNLGEFKMLDKHYHPMKFDK